MSSPRNLWARTGPHPDPEGDSRFRRRPGHEPHEPPEPKRPRTAAAWKRMLAGVAIVAVLGAGLLALEGDDDPFDSLPDAPSASGGAPARTDVGRVAAAAGPGVVSVQVDRAGGSASGTGFVVGRDGTIVTNAHVVGAAARADVRLDDGRREADAEVLGTDPSSDLAVLRVDPKDTGPLKPLSLSDSRSVAVGDSVVAIGHPFRLDRTVTSGIVSGVEREIEAPNGFQIDDAIQTDAAINPGNSGGPLVDARGRVIGVNSQIATEAGGNVGIGFAVPSNTVRQVLPRLERGKRVVRPYLGVSSTAAASRGAAVRQVVPGGPAADADLEVGDVIVGVDDKRVLEPDDVFGAISTKQPGDTVEVKVRRDGEERSVKVKLGTRPERSP